MGCKINSPNTPILCQFSTKKPNLRIKILTFCSSPSYYGQNQRKAAATQQTQLPKTDVYTVKFKTLGACKLGISRYPDFEYDAGGGMGTGTATKVKKSGLSEEVLVSFDVKTLYIPPLTSATTMFLGLPLPPFLKIDIVPELFEGSIDQESGKVDLEFKAKFWFSVGSIYKAPPLLVETVLTSEESKGTMRGGRGERLDKEGKCRLVGVSTVDPIDDLFMNSFLSLPTQCIADLNAIITFSTSY